MHGKREPGKPDGAGPLPWVFGIGMLLLGVLCAVGAWRAIAGRDGLALVIVPAALLPVLAASLARRTVRKKRP